jgi:hypothetical protein
MADGAFYSRVRTASGNRYFIYGDNEFIALSFIPDYRAATGCSGKQKRVNRIDFNGLHRVLGAQIFLVFIVPRGTDR